MQGQRSAIGSLPDSINFDYGSSSSNVGIDQQICWNNLRNPAESRLSDYRTSASNSDAYMGSVGQEGQNLRRWSIGESSSSSPPNQVSHDERMTQSGWSPSMNASAGASLRLEGQRYELPNVVPEAGVNLNLSSNHLVNGPAFMRSSNSGPASQNTDINEGQFHRVGDGMDYPSSSKPLGSESKLISSGSSSSDPFASSSGSGGFLMEEDDGRPGCSLDGRRLSCKRKTLEGNGGSSSSSGGCFPRAESGIWHAVPPRYDAGSNQNVSVAAESSPTISPPEQVNPRLGLGIAGGVSAESFRAPSSSHRNYRLRINPSVQQDSMSNNNSFLPVPTAVGAHTDIPPVHQPLRFANPPLDLMSPIPPDNLVPQSQSMILRVPSLRRNMQALRWNGVPNLRPGSSSSSALLGERDAALPEDLNPRHAPRSITDHHMLVPPVDARSSAQNPTNWSLGSGNVGIPRNITSSSRIGSSSGSHNSAGPGWVSHRHPSSQYSRRLSEYVRRSLLSTVGSENAGQSSNNSQHRSGPASSQEGGILPPAGGNQVHSQSHSRSGLWLERQGDGAVGIPYFLRALAAGGEGRSRIVSEIRSALDIMRRGEALRVEDFMFLDQSVVFGMVDIHDQHRDLRLDVDNMSYEELLALEERIGNVCTGLSEEMILKRMKQRKYIHTMSDDQTDNEPCCVCQEEYNDGEDLGTLDCGHDFHKECIKQWLAQKNLCPICKTTALAT